MKKNQTSISAIPSKKLYQSIIADYSQELAICELIDNSIDLWVKGGKTSSLNIKVIIDTLQQTICVEDNAGGIPESDIKLIIAPGFSSNTSNDETIGVFGVGSKRAVVALSQEIKIKSRHNKGKTLIIEYNDNWIEDENWNIDYFEDTIEIEPNSTLIELSKLRALVNEKFITNLQEHLASTYAKFLMNSKIKISLNDIELEAKNFDLKWSYPPNYHPQKYKFSIDINSGEKIEVEILAGLTSKDQVGEGEYGVYFFCNDRLVLRADKSYEMGFASGIAGIPHPSLNAMRIFVYLKGNPERMPWNSSKSGINYKNKVFEEIRDRIIQIVTYFAKLSRSFSRNNENIFKYTTGTIVENKIDVTVPIKLYPLPSPVKKPIYSNIVKEKNKSVAAKKPWTVGLYEAIILGDNLINSNFESKNRFALIILDSTLEIAMKEYLVHVVAKKTVIGSSRLITMLQNRTQVEAEVKNYLGSKVPQTDWVLIDHYYKMRCNLIHQVSTADVKDSDIEKHRAVVEKVLGILFKLKF
jgi:histidine kinase/DNA gyrase B/HSP90-like ATPase